MWYTGLVMLAAFGIWFTPGWYDKRPVRVDTGLVLLVARRQPASPARCSGVLLCCIVVTMIQHDLYHAGEINHLRSQHQSADQWE
jgi:hypothetical protein